MDLDLITWLIVGLVAGTLASVVLRRSGFGVLGDLVLGVVGAVVGGWTFGALGWSAPLSGIAGVIVVAFAGSIIVLVLFRLIRALPRGEPRA